MSTLYLKARDACIENVVQYLKDTKKLMETGSYGHACALLILGREELGKAFTYHNIVIDKVLMGAPEPLIKSHTKTPQAHLTKLMMFSFLSALKEAMEKKNYMRVYEFLETSRAREEGDNDRAEEQHAWLRERERKNSID